MRLNNTNLKCMSYLLLKKKIYNTDKEKEAIERIYPLCVSISIDYAIMEKANNVYVIPAAFGWSDLGTWNSAYTNLKKDEKGNALAGDNIINIRFNQFNDFREPRKTVGPARTG